MGPDQTAEWVARLSNAAWHVRYRYQGARRVQAIQVMGLTVREAFIACPDYAPMLRAVAEGLTDEKHRRTCV